MKYMIMMFGSSTEMMETRSPEWIRAMIADMQSIDADLKAAGEFVDGQGLADGATGKIVSLEDGIAVATDGPYAEAKELAGFWIVDVESEARAVEIAARAAEYAGTLEVRQVMDGPPEI